MKWRAYLSALIVSVTVGFSFLFVRDTLHFTTTYDALTYRFIAGFLPLAFSFPFMKGRVNFCIKKLKKLSVIGFAYPLVFFAGQALALKLGNAVEVAGIFAMAPVITLILAAIILKETTTVLQRLSVFVSAIGVILIVASHGISIENISVGGILIAILSTISFSVYTILLRGTRGEYNGYEFLFFLMGQAVVVSLIFSILMHSIDGQWYQMIIPLKSSTFIRGVLYLSILSTLLSAYLTSYSLKYITATQMSVFNNLSTVIQILAGIFIVGEKTNMIQLIGCVLIIVAVLSINIKNIKNKGENT